MLVKDWRIIKLRETVNWNEKAIDWFHDKWKVPKEAYLESILACQKKNSIIPQWYLVLDGDTIIGGLGVIENDFHKRYDISPNVCAVYVIEEYRNQGIAKIMLDYVCHDLAGMGYTTLYLITSHTIFYEKCGWEFLCMLDEDDGSDARIYQHRM